MHQNQATKSGCVLYKRNRKRVTKGYIKKLIEINVTVRNAKDLYGKGLILKNIDNVKIIIVLASICVLSC